MKNLGTAFIYRNRSGYQGCTFLVDGTERQSVTQKSHMFYELAPTAKKLPIVSMENGSIDDLIENADGTFDVYHSMYARITKKTAMIVGKAYVDNNLKFSGISFNCDSIIIKGANFNF